MYFLRPEILYGLILLVIPVLIHLFSFRRQRTIYFSTLRFLREVEVQHRRRSRIQDLLILILRMLAMAFLILAFAQPVIRGRSLSGEGGQEMIALHIDNSPSMQGLFGELTLLDAAIKTSVELAETFPPNAKILLSVNDGGPLQSGPMYRSELMQAISQIKPGTESLDLLRVIKQYETAAGQSNVRRLSLMIVSDFQSNSFPYQPIPVPDDWSVALLPLRMAEQPNLTLDSCWFSEPVMKTGQDHKILVKVTNHSRLEYKELPIRFNINGRVAGLTSINLSPYASTITAITPEISDTDWKTGIISISDYPITFDNDLFVSYKDATEINVLYLHASGRINPDLKALFEASELFNLSVFDVSGFPFTGFEAFDLVVLANQRELASPVADMTIRHLKAGGSLWFIPEIGHDYSNYNRFFVPLGLPSILRNSRMPLRAVIAEDRKSWFNAAILNPGSNLEMPLFREVFQTIRSDIPYENLLSSEGGESLISRYRILGGVFYWSSFSMTDTLTDLPRHPMVVPLIHEIASYTSRSGAMYHQLGGASPVGIEAGRPIQNKKLEIRQLEGDFRLIPPQRQGERMNQVLLDVADIPYPGNYSVVLEEEVLGYLSFNLSREESELVFIADSLLSGKFGSLMPVTVINPGDTTWISQMTGSITRDVRLIFWALLGALCMLAIESLVIRLKR